MPELWRELGFEPVPQDEVPSEPISDPWTWAPFVLVTGTRS
jgi:hypothetical protein